MMDDLIRQKAKAIKLLALDVDGTLTPGYINYNHLGQEIKSFHAHDGLALSLLVNSGIIGAIITGRESTATLTRAQELGITEIWQKVHYKRQVLESIMERYSLEPDQCAYMGDDVNDLPCLNLVGLAMSPADARPEVLSVVHWTASLPGGQGAVRQACELIMKAAGTWEQAVASFQN